MKCICGIIDFHKTPSDRAAAIIAGSAEIKAMYPAAFINMYMTLLYDRGKDFSICFAKDGRYILLCNPDLAGGIVDTYEKSRGISDKCPLGNSFYILYDSQIRKFCMGKGDVSVYYTFLGSALLFSTDFQGLSSLPYVRGVSSSKESGDISELKSGYMEFSRRGLFYAD